MSLIDPAPLFECGGLILTCLLLTVVLFGYRRLYGHETLRLWAWGWLLLTLGHLGALLAGPAAGGERPLFSAILGLACLYGHATLVAAGAWTLSHRGPSRRDLLPLALGIAAGLTLVSAIALTRLTGPAAFLVSTGLPRGASALAMFAGVAGVLRPALERAAYGRRILLVGLGLRGLQDLGVLVAAVLSITGDFAPEPFLRLAPLAVFAHGAIGLGTVIWLLNEEQRRRERAGRELLHNQDRLRRAQRLEAIGRLAGGIAHDFNNLLTVIGGHAELLSLDIGPDDRKHHDLNRICEASRSAADLTRELLAFSRRQILREEVFDLGAFAVELRPFLEHILGDEVAVHLDVGPASCYVTADRDRLREALGELAIHARESMPRGGEFSVRTRRRVLRDSDAERLGEVEPGPHALIELHDSGEGVAAEDLPHLFEPFFFTAEGLRKGGLGLATVQGLVVQSGGAIEAASRPGSGTTFRIFLPLVDQQVFDDAREAEPLEALGHGRSVLLAEDDARVRDLTRRTLEQAGYRVTDAPNGERALDAALEAGGDFDLLLSDVVMPGMHGPELAERVQRRFPRIRVLLMSGFSERLAAEGGPVELLAKPFQSGELLAAVRRAGCR